MSVDIGDFKRMPLEIGVRGKKLHVKNKKILMALCQEEIRFD
jgi:hypothetical protein